ncbi:MAG: EAL domain-containing protein, partial [Sulfuritalea sp.]|nr:EAL domain-containing protein [Sulfuritalea sp.]
FHMALTVDETRLNDRKVFIGSVSDISARKAKETELRIAAAAFESLEGMLVTDARGVILRVNQAFINSTGYTAKEAIGQTPRLLKSDRHDAAFYRELWQTLLATGSWEGEIWDRRKSGEVYPKWLTISAVKDAEGVVTHYVGTHQDITERKLSEQRIAELAYYDQLTSLPNRTLLLDRLRQAITATARSNSHGALLFIDLDNFKTLNDTLGHDQGDLLLKLVAQRLTHCVRAGDTVARLGGDEFVAVLAEMGESDQDAANRTEAVGEKILASLNQSYPLDKVAYHSTPSIGVTLFKGNRTSIDDLLKQADLAMYKAKDAGRNALRFFDPDMETAVMERAALESDLRQAVRDGHFQLHYQAQVLGANRVTGAEVLARWQHPQRGMVSPSEFIPLAEETGLILSLGHWVLEAACTQLAEWAARPQMSRLTVAVNVSAQQFRDPGFVATVLATLQRTGANPSRLKLELTESMLVENVEDLIEKMSALQAMGVGFALDDFGTGYSSLSYLKRLPLDQLKIDKSFVRDILVDANDAAIARTIVALAASLGLDVIAEGVETGAQRDFLAARGCHAWQGNFFSEPLPVAGFEEFVRRASST